ncbi:MAG TPA: class I SAM-dependent methyltransferase [Rhizomicrobium sp.]|nr:class I SAM-dependent methyltransferase [Rhizomicrobium sp.]
MSESVKTYDPNRFKTNVPYYTRYRLGYPQRLVEWVVAHTGTKPGDAVMDLGCGPGLLAIPFAREGLNVVGVDPEPAMLAAAQESAREAGVTVAFRQGSSYELPTDIGPFKLVTMGRAFHWMDGPATLKALDARVVRGGAVVLMHDLHTKTAENRWRAVLHDVGNEFGRDTEHHIEARNSPDFVAHESALMNSPFGHLERISVFVTRAMSADDIVGLAFSLSTSSPQKLGARKGEFETRLRSRLAELSADGQFTEIAEMTALIATRPGERL